MESPLTCSPRKAESFLHLQLPYRNLYALQSIAKQSDLISLESPRRGITAQTQLSTVIGGFVSSLSLPDMQPTYHKTQADREGNGETSLQNHLSISDSRMWHDTSLEKKSPQPTTLRRNSTRHQLTPAITPKQQIQGLLSICS